MLSQTLLPQNTRIGIFYDSAVKDFLQEGLALGVAPDFLIALPGSGEKIKNLDSVSFILNALLEHGFQRKDIVVAIGGGASLDTVGFASSIYMRGISWIAVPTTLLSICDAAWGGKTAINLANRKNPVGAFHEPLAVLPWWETLKTLPLTEWKSGLGELWKMSLIHSHKQALSCLEWLDSSPQIPDTKLKHLLTESISLKHQVVQKDPREAGLRAILNLGHTIGHALEIKEGIPHGVAVALGILHEAQMGQKLGLVSESMTNLCETGVRKLGLKSKKPDWAHLLEIMGADKKNQGSTIGFSLIQKPGADWNQFQITRLLMKDVQCALSA